MSLQAYRAVMARVYAWRNFDDATGGPARSVPEEVLAYGSVKLNGATYTITVNEGQIYEVNLGDWFYMNVSGGDQSVMTDADFRLRFDKQDYHP